MATLALLLLPFLISLLLFFFLGGGAATYGRVKRLIYLLRHASQVHDIVTRSLKSCGGTLRYTHVVVTSDPRNVHHVFSKCYLNFPKGPEFQDMLEALGEGIFNSDGENGLLQRRVLHSLLSSPEFEDVLMSTLCRKLESGLFPVLDRVALSRTELDLQDVFKRFMFDNICTTVLGFDPNYLTVDLLPDLPYAKAYDEMEEAAFYRHILPSFCWKFQRWIGIGEERKLRKAWDKFDQFLYERIKLKRDSFRKSDVQTQQFDMLTAFMSAEGEIGRFGESDKLLRDTAFNLIAAGRDTVTVTLVWLLWLVASNPKTEAKILEEIEAILGENSENCGNWRFFSDEELSKLVYLHGAVCEALRLYPPVPFEHRTAAEEETLPSGHRVKKNGRILFSIYSMGRMEEIWGEDWMDFKPERWMNSEGTKIVHVPSYKFMTFAAGPRSCLGKKIAFVYAKQVASALLYNYKVDLVDGLSVGPAVSIVLFMKDGLKVRVRKRV
ncbi:Alkane hydroxylase MAH1 [Linum perenne]